MRTSDNLLNGRRVAVIGGGLAGMTAAWRLTQKGYRVTLFERGRHLGGRAASLGNDDFLIDNGQHLFLDACSALARIHNEWGIVDFFDRVAPIRFLFEGGHDWRFGAMRGIPGRLKFLPSLCAMTFLSLRDKITVARLVGRLERFVGKGESQENFGDFLTRYSTSDRARNLFWNPILLSALGDFPENVALSAAAKVIREGIFAGKGPILSIPNRPLRAIYHDAVFPLLTRNGIEVRLMTPVDRFYLDKGRVGGILLRSGESLPFDSVILAVDDRAGEKILRRSKFHSFADSLHFEHFRSGAVTALHFWFDRRLISESAVVLSGGIGQWLFCPHDQSPWASEEEKGIVHDDASFIPLRPPVTFANRRGAWPQGEKGRMDLIYHQVLISGSHRLSESFSSSDSDWTWQVLDQLRRLFPSPNVITPLKSRITTVPRAVLLPTPSLFGSKPSPFSPCSNLFLAGDWMETGWPSTLEGAVRSGENAVKGFEDISKI